MNLEQRILGYNFESDELDEVAEMTTADELFAVLNQLLQSTDTEAVVGVLGFIRDFMIMRVSSKREQIHDRYPGSALVKTIENLLFCPNYFIRRNAVYTLGKTCSYKSTSIITKAFHHFRDTVPILLPRLLGELGWLGGETFDECIIAMAKSPVYTTRWASIPLLCEFGDEPKSELYFFKLQQFEQLRNDQQPLVQHEAEYRYQLQKFVGEYSEPSSSLGQADRRQFNKARKARHKGLEVRYQPEIHFDTIANTFCNHLYQLQQVDYTIAELEIFVEQYVAFREQLRQEQKSSHTIEELENFLTKQKNHP